jgi:hypothetical protein
MAEHLGAVAIDGLAGVAVHSDFLRPNRIRDVLMLPGCAEIWPADRRHQPEQNGTDTILRIRRIYLSHLVVES